MIEPRFVNTSAAARKAGHPVSGAHIDYVPAKIPLSCLVLADEIAAFVACLASDEYAFRTVAVFEISGGRATE
jgi:2-dehydro-3-deoxy-L-rhamnonate dehydrogenase (NAD+)